MTDLKTYSHAPASRKAAQQLVTFLHCLGANGQDLIDLAPFFAHDLPDAVFVSPDAPYACDLSPTGYQWFSLQEWTPESVLRGVEQSAPILDGYITGQMEKYNVPASKTALVGFSQGTMMALHVGPRFPEPLAGVLGYSGALVWEDEPDLESMHKIPVHLIHGDSDSVVPVTAFHHAKEALEGAGFPVSGGVTPGLAHNIDEMGIQSGKAFLKQILK